MLSQLLQADLFAVALIFARFGSAMMVLPGVGQQTVPMRARLLLALAVSVAVAPAVAPGLPRLPEADHHLAHHQEGERQHGLLVMGEVVIGLFIGTLANVLASALQIAGMIIAFQSNLASATIFNPMLAQETSVYGSMLASMAILLVFITDLDHQAFIALVDSYRLFQPGLAPDIQLMTSALGRVVSDSFKLAMQISAPFLILSFVFNIALGLMARLVPQMQVFFVGIPLQILGSMAVLALTLAAGMALFMQTYAVLFSNIQSGR